MHLQVRSAYISQLLARFVHQQLMDFLRIARDALLIPNAKRILLFGMWMLHEEGRWLTSSSSS